MIWWNRISRDAPLASIGEERVNVLELNPALEQIAG
jgi:K+-transporting ATPase c subunit